ncbi:Transposable element Tcb1 transposase [Araneus ventricosus]|uniref:Transposable element Tcb1 transposase n=1 Tax=Araneus ventricosus TaxID=182803 RepID=A0A4Y2BK40_ARAVE|nr:Transposable element Tcb1 transposase [Araneus ventricosus]
MTLRRSKSAAAEILNASVKIATVQQTARLWCFESKSIVTVQKHFSLRVSKSSFSKRRLQAAGLNRRRPVKKPMISAKKRNALVEWAKAHKDWTKKEWEDVLWSDEGKYMLFGTDGIQLICRPQGTRFDPKYQFSLV